MGQKYHVFYEFSHNLILVRLALSLITYSLCNAPTVSLDPFFTRLPCELKTKSLLSEARVTVSRLAVENDRAGGAQMFCMFSTTNTPKPANRGQEPASSTVAAAHVTT